MSPRMGAASDEKNESVVDANAHGESRLLHFGKVLPLIFDRVVSFNRAPNVLADPASESIEVSVKGTHSKLAAGNGH